MHCTFHSRKQCGNVLQFCRKTFLADVDWVTSAWFDMSEDIGVRALIVTNGYFQNPIFQFLHCFGIPYKSVVAKTSRLRTEY